jgi:hypothetical protein
MLPVHFHVFPKPEQAATIFARRAFGRIFGFMGFRLRILVQKFLELCRFGVKSEQDCALHPPYPRKAR